MKYVFTAIIALIIFGMTMMVLEHQELMDNIKDGKIEVYCHLQSGYQFIEPEKIVDVDMDNSVVIFTNGSARNCEFKRDR